MNNLNEFDLRLPTFRAGEPVRLSDGQAWFLRTPRVVVEAVIGGYGTTLIPRWRLGGSADVDDLFDRLMLARVGFKGSHAEHYLKHVVDIAILQLMGNYHLSRHDAHMLLLPAEGSTPEEILGLMISVATAAVNRPFELLQAAQAKLPYQSAADYARLDTSIN